LVLDAIEKQRFFVFTHPDDPIAAVRARLAWMEGGPATTQMGLEQRISGGQDG